MRTRFIGFFRISLAAAAASSLVSTPALTFELNAIVSGTSPNPVIVAEVTDVGAGKVQFKFDATGLAGFANGKISDWTFNYDAALDGTQFGQPTFIPGSSVGSASLNGFGTSEELETLPPQSGFDLKFSWATSNGGKFAANEVLVYELQYAGPEAFSAASFNYSNPGGYYTAAHIQGLTDGASIKRGDNDGGSDPGGVRVADGGTTAALLGIGLLGAAAARKVAK